MAFTTMNSDELAKLTLIASDQAYLYNADRFLDVIEGVSPLAPLDDTPGNLAPPYGYEDSGFIVKRVIEDSQSIQPTGFKAVIYKNDKTNEIVVAFAGTDGPNLVDWWSNIMTYGWSQWAANGEGVLSALRDVAGSDLQTFTAGIHFTGQSLGGALAQYAAYDFLSARKQQAQEADSTYDPSSITLTTFNALGGLAALRDNRAYNPTILTGLGSATHYVVENDIIHLLGEGLVGGRVKKLLVFDGNPKPDGRRLLDNGGPFAYGLVDAHRIESGFYQTLAQLNVDFGNTAGDSPRYLQIRNLQRNTARLGNPLRLQAVSSAEAAIDIVASSLPSAFFTVASGNGSEVNGLIRTFVDSLYNSGNIASHNTAAKLANTRWDLWVGLFGLIGVATGGLGAILESYVASLLLGRLATGLGRTGAEVSSGLRSQFGFASQNENMPDQSFEEVSVQGDILLTRAKPDSAFTRLGTDPEELAQRLASGTEWLQNVLGYIRDTAYRADLEGPDKFKTVVADVANEIRQIIKLDATLDATLLARTERQLEEFTKSIAYDLANANSDLERKYSSANPSLFVPDSLGAATYGEYEKVLEAALRNPEYRGINSMLQSALDIVASAGERPLLEPIATSSRNPFDMRDFDPNSVPVQVSDAMERGAESYRLYVPYPVGPNGQRVKLTFAGDPANVIRLAIGDDVVDPQDGELTLTLEAGEREKSFAVITAGDFDIDETVHIFAALVDDAGNPTHRSPAEATLTLNAHQEQAAQVTLSGGDASDAFSQSERDYVGQRVNISGGDGADLIGGAAGEDTLDGGPGDDIILGAGGQDAIAGGDGNDLITVSGEGAAHIDGGPGDDVVDALRLIDGHVLPTDGGSPFGWRGVAPDILPHLQVVPQGDPRGNRADNAPSGLPYAIELASTSFSGTSSEIGLVGGQLAVTPGGGAGYSVTQGDSNNWLVTYTAGAQSRTFDFSFGLIGVGQNAAGVSIDGGDGNDQLIGSLGEDFVRGGTGNDVIAGHDGDDVVLGDAGADSVFAGEGNDFLDGGADDDVLFGESGNDALYGGDGADHLEGDGAGTPLAQQGDDYLNGEGGDDELIGEAGIDVVIGGDGNDRLYGGDDADELIGGTGNDLLQGGDGDDTLDAGADNDVLFGEAGDDSLSGGEGYDQISGGDGDDLLEGGAGGDFLAGDAGNDTLYGDEGADQLTGNLGDDILIGGVDDDLLDGGDGSDRIEGDEGNDMLRGGAGKDTYALSRGDGTDTLDDSDTGANASVVLLGPGITRDDLKLQRGSLVLDFGQGDALHIEGFDAQDPSAVPVLDRLEFSDGTKLEWTDLVQQGFDLPGSDAAEYILGTTFTDRIDALGGADTVTALSGNDNVDAGTGDDFVFAGPGNDTVFGGSGNDYLELDVGDDEGQGGEGADFIAGGPGNDIEHGDAGDDSLSGDEGDDVLVGGAGDDELYGGVGADSYVFARGDGRDSISDSGGGNTLEFLRGNADALGVAQVTVTARHDSGGTLSIVADYGASAGSDVITVSDPFTAIASGSFTNAESDETETFTFAQFIEGANTPSVDLAGTDSAEILDGGFSDDRLDGGMGDDVLYGLWGDDQVRGGIGDDRAYADRGDDWLAGEAGDDLLDGGEGNDILAGGIGTNRLYGGPGSDQYVLEDGSMQLIEEDATPGVETIRLAPGRSMANLRAYRAGDDLALDDFEGAGQAYVNGFFRSPASKTWVLAGDLEAPRDLRAFVAERLAEEGDDFAARRKAFEVGLRGDLALRGGRGESLGGLSDYRVAIGSQLLDYRFSGVTADAIDAAGGMVLLPRSESETSETHAVAYTWTSQVPVYTVQLQPGASWDVAPPSGTTGIAYPAGTSVSQNADGSLHLQEPDTNRTVPSGAATITHSFPTFATQVERSFTLHQVVGSDAAERFVMVTDFDENGNFYPTGPRSFRGSIEAGGGDDVIFTPAVGADDYGDDYSLLTRRGRGALIDGGPGDDVIGGTNGDDEILLGEGDDLVDGGAGADTYYAPFAGGGTDVVHDSAHPSSLTLMYGGLPPEDVMAFAPGVTLDNLRYRMTDGRTPPVTDDFHPYGFYSTLEAVPPASALRTLQIDWGTDTKLLVVDSRSSGGVWGGIGIERYSFADGTTLSREEFLAQVSRIENPVVQGSPADELLAGTPGDDTFVIDAKGGVDRIAASGGFDTLAFGEDISPSDISLGIGSLVLRIGTAGDAVHIDGFDPEHALEPGAIGRFVFADGTELTHAELVARGFDLTGTAGDDTIRGTSVQDRMRGGAGNDLLIGGAGDDIYFFDAGDGADHLVDADGYDGLVLGAGLSADSLTVRRGDGELHLAFGAGDSVAVEWDPDAQKAIEFVQFADSTFWDGATLEAHIVPNRTPSASDDLGAVSEDGLLEVSGNALANDADGDGDGLEVADPGTFSGTYGTLSLATNGSYRYVLSNDSAAVQSLHDAETVTDAFSYVVGDGIDTASAAIRVSIAGANDAPVARADSNALSEDETSASGNVLGNDIDADADTVLSVSAKTVAGTYGTLRLDVDGAYTYTLAGSTTVQSLREGQSVTDRFGYSAMDGIAATAGTLTVSVLGRNDAPVLAHPLADQNIQVGRAFSLAAESTFTDIDQGDALAYAASWADGAPLPAWLAFNPSTRIFSGTPSAGDAGTLQLRLTATDLAGASANDIFSITVAGSANRTFDFQKSGVWPFSERTNVGSPGKVGTGDEVSIKGKNRSRALYAGGAGVDMLNGTSGADALLLDDETSPRLLSIEIINMGAGDDVVDLTSRRYAYGDVTLNGDAGKDVLWASAGNDILDGGAGDDVLAGGAGNDVYVHGAASGKDVISETAGQDVIRFASGIAPNAVTVSRREKDLVLSAGANGSVTVKNWFGAAANRVEQVQFADGTVWNEAQLSKRANDGTSGHGESSSGGGSEMPHGSGDGRAHRDDDPRSESSGPRGKSTAGDAADLIAALLGKQPNYDFSAVADYLSRQYKDGGSHLSTAEIELQWRTLERYAAGLAHVDPHVAEAAHDRGFAGDLLRAAASAMAWGYEGSTGVTRPTAGMSALQGLSEGLQRLR